MGSKEINGKLCGLAAEPARLRVREARQRARTILGPVIESGVLAHSANEV